MNAAKEICKPRSGPHGNVFHSSLDAQSYLAPLWCLVSYRSVLAKAMVDIILPYLGKFCTGSVQTGSE